MSIIPKIQKEDKTISSQSFSILFKAFWITLIKNPIDIRTNPNIHFSFSVGLIGNIKMRERTNT